jgi:hypothetical protein
MCDVICYFFLTFAKSMAFRSRCLLCDVFDQAADGSYPKDAESGAGEQPRGRSTEAAQCKNVQPETQGSIDRKKLLGSCGVVRAWGEDNKKQGALLRRIALSALLLRFLYPIARAAQTGRCRSSSGEFSLRSAVGPDPRISGLWPSKSTN